MAALAAAITMASIGATASHAAPSPAGPEVKIGMLDTMVYRVPIRDKNMSVLSKDMTGGKAARWDSESGSSHGELVAASAVKAARVQNPDARISLFAANIYRPSDVDVGRDMRGPKSDPDASRVHLTLDYAAADKAITWFKDQGVTVVVMTGTGQDSPRMRALADKVRDSGMVMVASTNNVTVHGKVFPAAYPDVISVAGYDKSLPIWNSPELASYVSYVADARVPLRDGRPEIGSSFAAGALAGVLAAGSSGMPSLNTAAAKQWLDSVAAPMECDGRTLRRVASDVRFETEMKSLAAAPQIAAASEPSPRGLAKPSGEHEPDMAVMTAMAAKMRGFGR